MDCEHRTAYWEIVGGGHLGVNTYLRCFGSSWLQWHPKQRKKGKILYLQSINLIVISFHVRSDYLRWKLVMWTHASQTLNSSEYFMLLKSFYFQCWTSSKKLGTINNNLLRGWDQGGESMNNIIQCNNSTENRVSHKWNIITWQVFKSYCR